MRIRSDNFAHMQPIAEVFALGRPGSDGNPCEWSDNWNPHLAWSDVPARTRSFAISCIDSDAPTRADDVNQPDRRVPATLARGEFVHWLMVDISPECREIATASCGEGVVAHGKRSPPGPPGSQQGLNDYTGWFADDPGMAGDYFGYDGPCPPWNDELVHHYHFRAHALDIPTLDLSGRFRMADVRDAMRTHLLAEAVLTGTYTLSAALRR